MLAQWQMPARYEHPTTVFLKILACLLEQGAVSNGEVTDACKSLVLSSSASKKYKITKMKAESAS
jgi:hypothetical protein